MNSFGHMLNGFSITMPHKQAVTPLLTQPTLSASVSVRSTPLST